MKKQIRQDILNLRNSISKEDIEKKSRLIYDRLVSFSKYKDSKTILSYINFGSEVITSTIIDYSLKNGKTVNIPYCIKETKEMVACRFTSWTDLAVSTYGILEPIKEKIFIADRSAIDFILIPGAAFDKSGNRVGYGAGYYDRFLCSINSNIPKVALAYSIQIAPKVPRGIYDIPVDYIITEEGIIKC